MRFKPYQLALIAAVVAVLAVFWNLYSRSVEDDFANISRAEVTRIGDHYTGTYHRPSCPNVKQIYKGGKEFANQEEARAAGYNPCKHCDPDGPNE